MRVNREKAYDAVLVALKGPNPVGGIEHLISLQERVLDLEAALKDIKANAAAIYDAEIGRDSGIATLAERICDSIGKVKAQ